MPNRHHEQCLIDSFVCALHRVQDRDLLIRCIHNQNCLSRTSADLEFTAVSGQRWAIEAKYGPRDNKSNEVHKLFGALLRETGRECRQNCKIGLLLHQQMENYFRQGVNRIARQKFYQFGDLIPVRAVFVLSPQVVTKKTWRQFYNGESGTPVG